MFKKLGDTLKAKFSRQDALSRQLEIVKVFDLYKAEITKLFPSDQETRPQSLRNKILSIKATGSVMANELRLQEAVIIKKINQELGKEVIKRIVYRF